MSSFVKSSSSIEASETFDATVTVQVSGGQMLTDKAVCIYGKLLGI